MSKRLRSLALLLHRFLVAQSNVRQFQEPRAGAGEQIAGTVPGAVAIRAAQVQVRRDPQVFREIYRGASPRGRTFLFRHTVSVFNHGRVRDLILQRARYF